MQNKPEEWETWTMRVKKDPEWPYHGTDIELNGCRYVRIDLAPIAYDASNLLPCPFCGGNDICHDNFCAHGFESNRTECRRCKIGFTRKSEAQSDIAWNTRAIGKKE